MHTPRLAAEHGSSIVCVNRTKLFAVSLSINVRCLHWYLFCVRYIKVLEISLLAQGVRSAITKRLHAQDD
jgi:hypothetical protein